jgi:hypothetical protein
MDKSDVMSSDRSFKIIFLFNLLYNKGSLARAYAIEPRAHLALILDVILKITHRILDLSHCG